LQDFIYFAYSFYCGLLETPTLEQFKPNWIEALGDLARYKVAVTAMVTAFTEGSDQALTAAAVAEQEAAIGKEKTGGEDDSDGPAARIDDDPGMSVGANAARLLEVDPEKQRWMHIAREWYSSGLADTPGTGRLHHHIGLLSRDIEGEELRGIYHFVKRYVRSLWILFLAC
jgi:hypothetical protein